MKRDKARKEAKSTIEEAKKACCVIGEKPDFALMSKMHLALIVHRLVGELAKKDNECEVLRKKLEAKDDKE